MTGRPTILLVLLLGGVVSLLVARFMVGRAPTSLTRRNVDGKKVPAVLGFGVVVAAALAAVAVGELAWASLIPVCGMFAAGLWDDLRGDERPRGFGGHLAAVRGGAITGGVVKLLTGAVVGLSTIAAVEGWELPRLGDWLLLAAPIALAANLINLLDRAPGRALKVFLILALPLFVFVPGWRAIGAGCIGAALALLPMDLKAEGMLGDAGANPLGAVLGLGFVLATAGFPAEGSSMGATVGISVLVFALVGLNVASERVSFSKVIETTPWLARLDHLGRK